MPTMLTALLVCLAVVSALDDLSPAETCNRACEKNYDRNEEDACKRGCSRADAIEIASSDSKNTNICNESCTSNYPESLPMANACKYGCSAYTPATKAGPEPFLSSIMNLFSRLHGLSSGIPESSTDLSDSQMQPNADPKIRVMVVRRFHVRLPNEDETEPDSMMDSKMPPSMMSGPFDGFLHMGNGQEADVAEPPMIPHMVMLNANEPSVGERISFTTRYMGSHLMIILFAVTLAALCTLLIVQFAIECKRRRRRANQFQFDQLPTYVEATTIKVPVDSDPQDELKEKPSNA